MRQLSSLKQFQSMSIKRLQHCTAAVLQARKLEGELDVKLASYAKLCSGFETTPGTATEQVLHTWPEYSRLLTWATPC